MCVLCLSWFLISWGLYRGPSKGSRASCYYLSMADDNESSGDWLSALYVSKSSPEWPCLIAHWHHQGGTMFTLSSRGGKLRYKGLQDCSLQHIPSFSSQDTCHWVGSIHWTKYWFPRRVCGQALSHKAPGVLSIPSILCNLPFPGPFLPFLDYLNLL